MPGIGVRSPSSVGLGMGVGGSPPAAGGAPPEPNPNLILWSEEMQRSVWTTSGTVLITPNDPSTTAPDGTFTADIVAFGSINAQLSQVTGIAATTGSVTVTLAILDEFSRFSASAVIDGTPYTLSVYLAEPAAAGSEMQLRLEVAGGFIRGQLRDFGDNPILQVWGWKLETPSLTAYVKREGT